MKKFYCGNPTDKSVAPFPFFELRSTPSGEFYIHPQVNPLHSALRVKIIKNTGPLESSLINIPITTKIGNNTTKAIPLANISNIRFIIRGKYFLFIFKTSIGNIKRY